MLPFIYCVFLMLVLIFLCCAKLGTAMPNIHKISYRGKQWLLENYSGEPYQFEQVSLRVDGQFFMLLVFSTPAANMRKTVLVFNDQLQKTEAKTLKIISKIKR
ncbi:MULTISPECIES: hypothetical protein [Legionella]|uniref:Uncharacterized protein n=2 Tax=Legionella septentrionalis TaxID=2498109 RepID=A0A433JKL3_9GAMM|nr:MULTISPECIES: hypothetical protein [Legionella]MCP0914475.1 hypothetical protein [Legionella sp. 27cVA30]RUQ89462.1 hypothetical protein EKM59_03425 [Legionella septentrionalis]RUQ97303.1 hypothetical protein ELY11_06545 [Legionella septentrionalis]RUR10475.1 hypothetical protein ELY14_05050 [Legionella septentrionalis]RUR16095.1 hypothetical protein ELY10_04125 [Legionella septentrionalis]